MVDSRDFTFTNNSTPVTYTNLVDAYKLMQNTSTTNTPFSNYITFKQDYLGTWVPSVILKQPDQPIELTKPSKQLNYKQVLQYLKKLGIEVGQQ